MKKVIVWLSLMWLAQCGFSQGMRFSLSPEQIEVDSSLAQPGDVPVPLSRTNINLEIINWQTALTPTPERGQFLIKLRPPSRVGSILVYANAEVSTGAADRWIKLCGLTEGPAQLRVLAVNPDSATDTIKLTARPQKQPDDSGFRATIPFLTLLPVRATNIAAAAEVSASSGNARELVDGLAEETQTVNVEPSGANSNAWIKLTWKEPQSLRGLALLGGRDPTSVEDLVLESSSATNAPFRMIDGRPTQSGEFRKVIFFVMFEPVTAKTVRIHHRNGGQPIRLGEVLVLQEISQKKP